MLHITSLAAARYNEDLLAHVRGHWSVEHPHRLRNVIRNEDKSPLPPETPLVMSALTNLVITLSRIQAVTRYTEEKRRNAQNPRRALHLLELMAPPPG